MHAKLDLPQKKWDSRLADAMENGVLRYKLAPAGSDTPAKYCWDVDSNSSTQKVFNAPWIGI